MHEKYTLKRIMLVIYYCLALFLLVLVYLNGCREAQESEPHLELPSDPQSKSLVPQTRNSGLRQPLRPVAHDLDDLGQVPLRWKPHPCPFCVVNGDRMVFPSASLHSSIRNPETFSLSVQALGRSRAPGTVLNGSFSGVPQDSLFRFVTTRNVNPSGS